MNLRTLLALVVTLGFSLGLGWADQSTNLETRQPSLTGASGPEELAVRLLAAMRQGDAETFVRLLNVEALYQEAFEQEDDPIEPGAFNTQLREAIETEFQGGLATDLEYEIVETVTIVRVRVRHSQDGIWHEHDIAFTENSDGAQITLEGMHLLDFGYGRPGPISREHSNASLTETLEAILEAVKAGDVDTVLDHIDLKGVYDIMVEQMGDMGELPEYDEWERLVRQEAKREAKPNDAFAYEVLQITVEDDIATATVKTKEHRDDEWEEDTIQMEMIDGQWKLTADSLMMLGK